MTPEAEKFNGWMAMIALSQQWVLMQPQVKSFQVSSNEKRKHLSQSTRTCSNARDMGLWTILCNNRSSYSRYLLMSKKNNEKTTDQVDFSIAEKWNGIAAIVGCVAAFASYSFTGQLIPGLV